MNRRSTYPPPSHISWGFILLSVTVGVIVGMVIGAAIMFAAWKVVG